MSTIFTFLLALTAISPFLQCPAQAGQSKEELPVSIKDLRNAPTEILLDGRSLTLSAYLWRDFAPTISDGSRVFDGQPMIAAFKVVTSDKKPFPAGVRLDRSWVLFGEQVWEAWKFRDQVKGQPYPKDSWINCSESPVCEGVARDGPKWGPGVFVDVVVRLTDKEGKHHFLQVRKQYVNRTD